MPFDVRDFPDAPPEERAATRANRRLVAGWLFAICAMILVMIGLGGATRLTGSGLSIMEWAPLSGTLPPMSDAEWHRLFGLYQQIPQYALLNDHMSLAGFKQIFWLEWVHRLWGRAIGLAFFVPLVWFWVSGRIEPRLRPRLAVIFLLGGLQGAVGWFMVASGFFPDSTRVAPYRLVVHLVLALALYAAILWTGLSVLRPLAQRGASGRLTRGLVRASCVLVGLTIVAGGFVAGTHAGFDYNTFPLMDGRLIPEGYARLRPIALNLVENIAAVQFDHRLLATATGLVTLAAVASGLLANPRPALRRALLAMGAAVVVQYALGVATLLTVVQVDLAVAHQMTAVLLLTAALCTLHAAREAPPLPVSPP
jgi:cytochrome c oxidase assembly protein subunit 15